MPKVKRTLDERDIDYFGSDETASGKYDGIVYISIPEEDVEDVLEDLYASGLDSDDHAVIINTEVDIFGRTNSTAGGVGDYKRIAAAELEGKTDDLLPSERTFVTMMLLATIVATTGLLLDSSAVVVGSMVLAPLFGPAVSTSVGTVINDDELYRRGLRFQMLGMGIAVVGGAIYAWVMRSTYLVPSGFIVTETPQIVARLSPDMLSLVVALVAGIAGVLSIATGSGRAIVGVVMAAALLPPAATVGIGLAWNEPAVLLHSGILLAVNVLAVNLAGLVTLWYLGYRPKSWIQVPQTRWVILKRSGTLLLALIVTTAFLWSATHASVQKTQVENAIQSDLQTLFSQPPYENVTLVEVEAVQNQSTISQRTDRVVVSIARPPGAEHRGLYENITAIVRNNTKEEVAIEIHVSLLVDPPADRSASSNSIRRSSESRERRSFEGRERRSYARHPRSVDLPIPLST